MLGNFLDSCTYGRHKAAQKIKLNGEKEDETLHIAFVTRNSDRRIGGLRRSGRPRANR
jgi:hypothetical protein